ncbi:MAG: ABATE domain-containing protein [Fidelibacterota bacterium]|nr:MAG: ABATE domain-containing protein [Candidatus Neomarinimicrobiota bacterium]
MLVNDRESDILAETAGGRLCLEFTNTVDRYEAEDTGDSLLDYTDLVRWAEKVQVIGGDEAKQLLVRASRDRGAAEAALRKAKRLRATIYQIFAAIAQDQRPSTTNLDQLNRILTRVQSQVHIVSRPEGFGWAWQAGGFDLEAVLWPVVRSAAELLTTDEVHKISQCNGGDCTWLFVDKSKNHSRKWCDMETCGNRVKSRRHYAKVRQDTKAAA